MENIKDNILGENIKKIRMNRKLTQEEFGKRIGSARNTIANYEMGNREPSNSIVTLICKEFGVNESWLRTGEGGDANMFERKFLEDEYMVYATEIGNGLNDKIKDAIIKYGRLSPENRKIIDDAINLVLEMMKEG